jgi:hypothetical protein
LSIDFGGVMLGIREGVIVLITLVAIYMAVVLLRMRRLRNRRRQAEMPPLSATDRHEKQSEPQMAPAVAKVTEEPEAWENVPSGLADGVLRQGLEQEILQLREEVDAIRGELSALRQDMLHELAHMRATQTVSPIYGDAMQMAAAGYEPAVIAERCGIARAEAELVVALAKSQER